MLGTDLAVLPAKLHLQTAQTLLITPAQIKPGQSTSQLQDGSSTCCGSPRAHLSAGHQELTPISSASHTPWLLNLVVPYLSRHPRTGREHWGHIPHWASSPWSCSFCEQGSHSTSQHSAWLSAPKATPTSPHRFFTIALQVLVWRCCIMNLFGTRTQVKLWNVVYFELSMLLWYIISFSVSQMLRQRNRICKKTLKKGFKCFKSYPALCQARRGTGIEDFI